MDKTGLDCDGSKKDGSLGPEKTVDVTAAQEKVLGSVPSSAKDFKNNKEP